MLSTRRRIDHQITFKTSPLGLKLAPGDFIRLMDTQLAGLQTTANAAVLSDGSLLTAEAPADGTYETFVYRKGSESISEETVEIVDGKVVDMSLIGSMINMPNTQERYGFYQIVQISLDEDFMVEIRANHHPVNDKSESKIVKDVLVDPNNRFSLNGRL
jgi:predicted phage tail protein